MVELWIVEIREFAGNYEDRWYFFSENRAREFMLDKVLETAKRPLMKLAEGDTPMKLRRSGLEKSAGWNAQVDEYRSDNFRVELTVDKVQDG